MLVSLTVGKVDAGVAVLLTEDKRLIEFPSILLPPDIHSGSIVDINVARNQRAEHDAEQKFTSLQSTILHTFGSDSPSPPVLRCRNATQTSVVLEWDPIHLATAELRSLSLHRNGTKAGVIPVGKLSTKISGLPLDTEYTFHLVLRTSAGQYSSQRLTVKTHKMTDLSGITISPGIMPSQLKDSLEATVKKVGAKMVDSVRIDTTHFVCTEPRGLGWEKAVEMNVPVVVPDWIKGCEREGRLVGVRGYYLDADPKQRQVGMGMGGGGGGGQQQRPSVSAPVMESPRIEHTPPTPERPTQDRGRENGAQFGAVELAAPPLKPVAEEERPPSPTTEPSDGAREADGYSIAGTTVVERSEEVDGESEDSDDTEKGNERHEARPIRGSTDGKEETINNEATESAKDDGGFDEVAL